MDPKARKLAHKLGDAELAEALALVDLDTPRKIKDAEDGDIEDAVDKATITMSILYRILES